MLFRSLGVAVTLLCGFAGCATAEITDSQPAAVTFVNGLWWNGESFDPGDRHIRDGIFTADAGRDAPRIDLHGGYVVPAFGEAHHHRACDEQGAAQFLRAGILYVGIMNGAVRARACASERFRASGIDSINALAGLTALDAHPSQIGLNFLPKEAIDGQWVHYVDSAADLQRAWTRIDAAPPEIVKVFLGYSEDYRRLRDDPAIASWYRGLDPALVPDIVRLARARGLRVAVHVLSAHDFDVAVSAGVDLITHMPGFAPGPVFTPEQPHPWLISLLDEPQRYLVSRTSAQRAAAGNVAVMTTMSGVEELLSASPEMAQSALLQQRVTRANVAMLRAAGVKLLIGSDRYDFTSVDEARYLVRNGMFGSAEALRSLVRDTPRALFPRRRIGALLPADEATFVVLADNPLLNFDTVSRPLAIYKDGRQLGVKTEAK